MQDLRVSLCGLELSNPVIAASGTFGYGREFESFFDVNTLGSLVLKGTTREPRLGNPQPRIAECPSGMLNAVGLQNPGIDAVVERELPRLAEACRKPVIANVCGFSAEEYVEVAAAFDAQPLVGLLEINISCPNVKHGGMSFGACAESAALITREVKAAVKKPVFMKLSPNVGDIVGIAHACEAAGADGLSLINTLLGMRIDIAKRRPLLGNVTGGLSGPAILPVALRMVYDVSAAVSIPVIGMGGVSRAEDVIEFMLAGASAVQVGAAALREPVVFTDIIQRLPEVMERLNITKLSEIIGEAHI